MLARLLCSLCLSRGEVREDMEDAGLRALKLSRAMEHVTLAFAHAALAP